MNTIKYYTKKGYEKHLEEIKRYEAMLKKELSNYGEIDKRLIDNLTPTSASTNSQLRINAIRRRLAELRNTEIIIIEEHHDSSRVDVGHIYNTHISYANGTEKELTFKLVSGFPSLPEPGKCAELSISSPIGNAIYKQPIGGTYTFKISCKTTETAQVTVLEEVKTSDNEELEEK